MSTANTHGEFERGQPVLTCLNLAYWNVGRAQVSETGPVVGGDGDGMVRVLLPWLIKAKSV